MEKEVYYRVLHILAPLTKGLLSRNRLGALVLLCFDLLTWLKLPKLWLAEIVLQPGMLVQLGQDFLFLLDAQCWHHSDIPSAVSHSSIYLYTDGTVLYLEMHFCVQGCASLWTLQVLGHLSAQEVHKFVCLKCKLTEDVHFNFALKCPRTWSVQVVHNFALKRAFPSSAQGLLPVSAQASFQVVHSSSYCCVSHLGPSGFHCWDEKRSKWSVGSTIKEGQPFCLGCYITVSDSFALLYFDLAWAELNYSGAHCMVEEWEVQLISYGH